MRPPACGPRRSGPRAGSCPDEVGERDTEGVGQEQQVSESGVTLAGLVSLDRPALYADAVAELLLGEAGLAAGGGEA